ncbi:MAG: adenylosuccinate synthase, partial [Myxococcota bacterium]
EEAARSGDEKIGTTKRGIGPAYADKYSRIGLRAGDLLHPEHFEMRLRQALEKKVSLFERLGAPVPDIDALLDVAAGWRRQIGHRIVDTMPILRDAIDTNRSILLEGQLGAMRDVDWGIYPYVTSSNPTAAFAACGAGLPPQALNSVLGVVKAYSTAVGAGPFPVELFDAAGEKLRDVGLEFGATTGRPRRCGWFDALAVRHSAWLNGLTGLAVTKLDVLDTFESIKLCVAYELDGERCEDMPDTAALERVVPVYEEWPGWLCSTEEARVWDDLPDAAKRYLRRISELADVPIAFVSVGPERDQLITQVPESA